MDNPLIFFVPHVMYCQYTAHDDEQASNRNENGIDFHIAEHKDKVSKKADATVCKQTGCF